MNYRRGTPLFRAERRSVRIKKKLITNEASLKLNDFLIGREE